MTISSVTGDSELTCRNGVIFLFVRWTAPLLVLRAAALVLRTSVSFHGPYAVFVFV